MSKVDDLGRARGYRVDTHDGRIGSVAAVMPRAGGRPGYLLVNTGLLACHLTSIPFSAVANVDPRRRRLVLEEHSEMERHGDRLSSARAT
jgi:hypothetical protein